MAVEITPRGSYGMRMPGFPRPLIWIFKALNVGFFRAFGNHVRVWGRPLLLLITVGAKTGRIHQTPLCWFPEAEGTWLIVGSSGGAQRHPAWFLNLAHNPDRVWIEVGGRKLQVEPESLKGDERYAAWQRVVALAPGYAGYQQKTDRVIPLIRLFPAPEPSKG